MWPCLQPHFLLSVQNDSVVSNFLIYCSSPRQVADLSLYEVKVLVTCLSFTFVPCLQLLPLQSLGRLIPFPSGWHNKHLPKQSPVTQLWESPL